MGINMGYYEVKLQDNFKLNNETLETKIVRMIEYIRFNMYAYNCTYNVTLFIDNLERIEISCSKISLFKRNNSIIELTSLQLTNLLSINNRAYNKIEDMYNQLRLGVKLFEDKTPKANKIVPLQQTRIANKVASFI